MQPDEVLEKAAEYIAENGWTQGSAYLYGAGSDHPPACALGAIGEVTENVSLSFIQRSYEPGHEAFLALAEHVGRKDIASWNDDPARTKEEVIETMSEAAQQWRKENA